MKRIAIIPARCGSKGLKDKNIKNLNGKPLIAYTIEAALNSNIFDKVHVSTDSEIYAGIAVSYGADVPFLRSKATSSDSASSWDVVKEVLDCYSARGELFDECILLQPTSPLRDSRDIIRAYDVFNEHRALSLVSVCAVDHPVEWCFSLDESLSMDEFDANPYKDMRRQQLGMKYRENGAIYIMKTLKLKDESFNFYGPCCYAYIMDRDRSIDIDTEIDFRIAEVMLDAMKENVK